MHKQGSQTFLNFSASPNQFLALSLLIHQDPQSAHKNNSMAYLIPLFLLLSTLNPLIIFDNSAFRIYPHCDHVSLSALLSWSKATAISYLDSA